MGPRGEREWSVLALLFDLLIEAVLQRVPLLTKLQLARLPLPTELPPTCDPDTPDLPPSLFRVLPPLTSLPPPKLLVVYIDSAWSVQQNK